MRSSPRLKPGRSYKRFHEKRYHGNRRYVKVVLSARVRMFDFEAREPTPKAEMKFSFCFLYPGVSFIPLESMWSLLNPRRGL